MHKQVLVIRKDLKMKIGKTTSQGAHASMAAVVPRPTEEDIKNGYIKVPLNEHTTPWFMNSFTKIVTKVDSEEELLSLYEKVSTSGIPCALIQDNGWTVFNGVKTYTALSIGPAHEDLINKFTSHLSLL